MRERGRGVSFFFSLSLSLEKSPRPFQSPSFLFFVSFCFRPPKTKEKICHTFLDLVSSQKGRTKNKDGKEKRQTPTIQKTNKTKKA